MVALAGNPNVGKSTLFNTLTGMNVHTGNWAGKTVGCESGRLRRNADKIKLVDIPGTYSLYSHSEEERIARDYVIFGGADVTVVVCDSCALRQNLNLALQIIEAGEPVLVVLNLADEAKKRGIEIDVARLSELLGVPVITTVGHKRKSAESLIDAIKCGGRVSNAKIKYPDFIECAISTVFEALPECIEAQRRRYLAFALLFAEESLQCEARDYAVRYYANAKAIDDACQFAMERLFLVGVTEQIITDVIASAVVSKADEIATLTVQESDDTKKERMPKLDLFLTGRVSAYPVMIALVALVFFLTLVLAAYPSELLSSLFALTERALTALFAKIGVPSLFSGIVLNGIFRTVGQVVAVMLPPMAIFFPLFSLLEDSGYLPRIAYNLDRPFACSGACGKQALTMCMGFGCNAVGIVGCRIIDSKRERVLAAVTNALVPCNGRLPMLVTLISVFYLFLNGGAPNIVVALTLSLLIVISIIATIACTLILSKTLYRGEGSSFTIELPPYRRPRFFRVIITSLKDKCASILLRAVTVAAPMGLVIYIFSMINIEGLSLLVCVAELFDPIGCIFGMDGAIVLAFVLALPANEIVIPILFLIYTAGTSLPTDVGLDAVATVFFQNGWSYRTALCTTVFALFHWPCSTSLITVYKETKSKKALIVAALLPTIVGLSLAAFINGVCLLIF